MNTNLRVLFAGFACVIALDVAGGYAALTWRYAGKTQLKSDTIHVCGKAETIDVRVSYSLNPIYPIGEPDPGCPWGFGPNRYRSTITLYRDSTPLGTHIFLWSGCWVGGDWFFNLPAEPGHYHATIKFERRVGPWVWKDVDSMDAPGFSASKLNAKPNFTINGKTIPDLGAAIDVNLQNPIVMDGSSTLCATKYFIGVEESDVWWNRTGAYEWGRWFEGAPAKSMNLQQLSTAYSVPPDWLGTEPTRQGTPLFGGDLPNTVARYYRVKLCTGEPAWNCQNALIRVH